MCVEVIIMKKILLTGGGTAGHVTPNLALLPSLRKLGYEIHYMGSYDGIEKRLIADYDIPYYGISTGKFRRYASLKNLTDPFRVLKGFSEAKKTIRQIRPDIVFSKGGFVSVPVVRAAAFLKIPCIIHESDMTPGLANKLCFRSADRICCNFPETVRNLPARKAVLTGSPIREELLSGDRLQGLRLCNFATDKPVIMIIGGSTGARAINQTVRASLDQLLAEYQIVHLCGKGNLDERLSNRNGYRQFEYVKNELKDLFAMADMVISRAGANSICELLALKKPNLLIPLPLSCSRGDQILNAESFAAQGYSMVLPEEDLTPETLVTKIRELYGNREGYIDAMNNSSQMNAVNTIIGLIEKLTSEKSK